MMDEDARLRTIAEFAINRRLAHSVLFRHRHPNKTPQYHYEMIDLIHSETANVLFLAFRGSGKSTLQEEATVLQACLGEFHNKVILGATRTRAIDRLTAIKYELEYNEHIKMLFGDMVGPTWNEDKVVLSNNVCIQAFGPGQSFRGVKYLEWRPDRLDIDDLEDEENSRDVDSRAALRSWLRRVVFPALAPISIKRVYATPLPDSLPVHLQRSSSWMHRTYPIYTVDAQTGEKLPSWPDFYPLSWVEEKEREYREAGAMQEFAQEYLCQPEDPATKIFTDAMLKVEPRVRTWHACYATYDPARSVGSKSATTGYAVFSWINNRLIIWRGGASLWLPDQIIDDIFQTNERYSPVAIGVENTGLVEFIDQPLRQRALKLGTVVPLVPLVPPRGKIEFIRALQPFFRAGEVEWAGPIDPEARAQLLSFPTGKKDFPNALAYALFMRPGQPVYDGFGPENIIEDLPLVANEPLYLAVNATPQFTTAVAVQMLNGGLRVVRDWVREGPPGDSLGDIVSAASMETGRSVRLRAPTQHFSDHDTLGLRAVAGQIPVEVLSGGSSVQGREVMRRLMSMQKQGRSLLLVSTAARWTLNGFAGGLAYGYGKDKMLTGEPREGAYRVVMEGLESFAAMMEYSRAEAERPRYATDLKGRRYLTTMPTADSEPPLKSEWHVQSEERPALRLSRG